MTNFSEAVRLPTGDEAIAPVTILDAQGRVVRVVSAAEFRRARSAATIANLDDQRARWSSWAPNRGQRRTPVTVGWSRVRPGHHDAPQRPDPAASRLRLQALPRA